MTRTATSSGPMTPDRAARAEQFITAQIVQHAARLDAGGRPMPECVLCGPLPGTTLAQHQARAISLRLVQAGLMPTAEAS